ncbi:hypothetical protein A0H81_09076 [Grifola frondosa]|uniref:Uncharacterized protein n=1 Tax=Grifola frondosa TaxID=5627 RepID=A0A1C7M0T1_GRIFR|nr:hypothetical protein A0H81_09076 [Grifola frondosa]
MRIQGPGDRGSKDPLMEMSQYANSRFASESIHALPFIISSIVISSYSSSTGPGKYPLSGFGTDGKQLRSFFSFLCKPFMPLIPLMPSIGELAEEVEETFDEWDECPAGNTSFLK